MNLLGTTLTPRRVYGMRAEGQHGAVAIALSDSEVVLDAVGHAQWNTVSDAIASGGDVDALPRHLLVRFEQAGLLVRTDRLPRQLSGRDFYSAHFEPLLRPCLDKAFSHPFWDRMMSGRGSARLYAGWLIELYHYTRNANRHMPLAVAHCRSKPIKTLLAKHYEEEYCHYHFFSRAAQAMGIASEEVSKSAPLSMTSEMSDFMRQAARTDVLCYAACSAVLEGTTTDKGSFNPFYERMRTLYDLPEAAVKPIYDHLALDAQYQHANLFQEICEHEGTLSAERASRALDFAHQMVEHIWLWTDEIERYYDNPASLVPRPRFDAHLD